MVEVKPIERIFMHGQIKLEDPDSTMTPEQVKDFYAASYPELSQAVIEEPERRGEKEVYKFTRAVGTKGGEQSPPDFITVQQLAKKGDEYFRKGGVVWVHEALTQCVGARRQMNGPVISVRKEWLSLLL